MIALPRSELARFDRQFRNELAVRIGAELVALINRRRQLEKRNKELSPMQKRIFVCLITTMPFLYPSIASAGNFATMMGPHTPGKTSNSEDEFGEEKRTPTPPGYWFAVMYADSAHRGCAYLYRLRANHLSPDLVPAQWFPATSISYETEDEWKAAYDRALQKDNDPNEKNVDHDFFITILDELDRARITNDHERTLIVGGWLRYLRRTKNRAFQACQASGGSLHSGKPESGPFVPLTVQTKPK